MLKKALSNRSAVAGIALVALTVTFGAWLASGNSQEVTISPELAPSPRVKAVTPPTDPVPGDTSTASLHPSGLSHDRTGTPIVGHIHIGTQAFPIHCYSTSLMGGVGDVYVFRPPFRITELKIDPRRGTLNLEITTTVPQYNLERAKQEISARSRVGGQAHLEPAQISLVPLELWGYEVFLQDGQREIQLGRSLPGDRRVSSSRITLEYSVDPKDERLRRRLADSPHSLMVGVRGTFEYKKVMTAEAVARAITAAWREALEDVAKAGKGVDNMLVDRAAKDKFFERVNNR